MRTIRLVIVWFFVSIAAYAQPLTIAKTLEISPSSPSAEHPPPSVAKIAVLTAPKVIGRYSQSIFNVALATTLASPPSGCEIRHLPFPTNHLSPCERLSMDPAEGTRAVLAPFTSTGRKPC